MEENFELSAIEKFNSEAIQGCLNVINSIVDYKLSVEDKNLFLFFHNFITNPQPKFITEWREDKLKEKWYHKFVNSILDDTQSALICVQYHFDKLLEIEKAVLTGVEKFNYKEVLGPGTVLGLGSSLVWDFEYQAFVLAYRRTLDYLSRGICCYFKNDYHSFRTLDSFLQKQNRPNFTKPLIDIHNKFQKEFDFVLSDGKRKSIRDRISHYEYVKVGIINLSSRGLILVGGGEELGLTNDGLLSESVGEKMNYLKACIRELITTYVECIKNDELEKAQ